LGSKKKKKNPLPQFTSANRRSAVAKSPPGLDHCPSTGVGEAFHHTLCVHISISISFRLYKKQKKTKKLFPLDYTIEPLIIRTENELIEEKNKKQKNPERDG